MKKQTRREFISGAAIMTVASKTFANNFIDMNKPEKKITHHVFFWLKNKESKEDLGNLIKGVRTLEKIETIRFFQVGVPADTELRPVVDASYSVSELLFFDNVEGQNIYQNHPIHKKFVENYSHLWEKVVVFDSAEV
jgi:hypothetical protein